MALGCTRMAVNDRSVSHGAVGELKGSFTQGSTCSVSGVGDLTQKLTALA